MLDWTVPLLISSLINVTILQYYMLVFLLASHILDPSGLSH